MALVSLRQLLDHAAEHGYGMPAFNINNMEQMLSVMAAAKETDSPVIMQASRGARAFANDIVLSHLIKAAIELYPEVPVCMHQDHGNSEATCLSAITNGFSSVMMDGSLKADGKTPPTSTTTPTSPAASPSSATWLAPRRKASSACSARSRPAWATRKTATAPKVLSKDQLLTDPDEAGEVRQAHQGRRPGHRHGHQPRRLQVLPQADGRRARHLPHQGDPRAHAERASGHARLVVGAAGSAGHHQRLRRPDAQTFGVPVEEIVNGIKHGVRKVNIDTDCRMAITGAIRKFFAEKPAEFDPRSFMKPAMAAMQKVCKQRYEEFGAAGTARRSR
jgi:fructose-bisphosphate aldolase (EC 4.1.2.13)